MKFFTARNVESVIKRIFCGQVPNKQTSLFLFYLVLNLALVNFSYSEPGPHSLDNLYSLGLTTDALATVTSFLVKSQLKSEDPEKVGEALSVIMENPSGPQIRLLGEIRFKLLYAKSNFAKRVYELYYNQIETWKSYGDDQRRDTQLYKILPIWMKNLSKNLEESRTNSTPFFAGYFSSSLVLISELIKSFPVSEENIVRDFLKLLSRSLLEIQTRNVDSAIQENIQRSAVNLILSQKKILISELNHSTSEFEPVLSSALGKLTPRSKMELIKEANPETDFNAISYLLNSFVTDIEKVNLIRPAFLESNLAELKENPKYSHQIQNLMDMVEGQTVTKSTGNKTTDSLGNKSRQRQQINQANIVFNDSLNNEIFGHKLFIEKISSYFSHEPSLSKPTSLVIVGPKGNGQSKIIEMFSHRKFGSSENFIEIDGAKYSSDIKSVEYHSLVGAPTAMQGQQKGELTEWLKKTNGEGTIVFKNAELIHPDIWNLLTSLFNQNQIKNGDGEVIRAKKLYITILSSRGYDKIFPRTTKYHLQTDIDASPTIHGVFSLYKSFTFNF